MALPRFSARIPRLPQKKAGVTQVVVVLSVIIFLLGSSAVAAYYFPNNPLVKAGKKLLASLSLPFWSADTPKTGADTDTPSPTVTPEPEKSDSLAVSPSLMGDETASLQSPIPILGPNRTFDTITASNIIYSIVAGAGITVGAGQQPTITNTGVLAIGGKTGEVYVDENGLKFDGNKLYNADKGSSQNIFKTIKVDGEVDVKADSNSTNLYLVAGTGLEIDTNNTEKTITFNGKAGWIDDGSVVRTLTDTDKVGVGTSNPTSLLSVGGSSEFQVNSAGNIVKINNVAYSFPSSQGSANSLLQNDGSGGLTWATVGASAITPDSLDFSEFKDAMTLDAATILAQAGFNFAFSGSGNVGVGTTTPNYKLDIAGTGRFTGNVTLDSLASGSTDTVVTHSSGTLQTRTIDSRAWGSTLVDGSGVASYVARWSDSNTLATGVLYDNGTNVGIGTSVPLAKLHVAGDGTYTAAFMSGNVGIGTTSPDAPFHVLSSTTPQFRLGYDASNYQTFSVSSAGNLTFAHSNGLATFAYSSGGVLDLSRTSGFPSITLNGQEALQHTSSTRMTIGEGYDDVRFDNAGTVSLNNSWLSNDGGNEGLRIDNSGNVGIATTSPGSKLSISGGLAVGTSSVSSTYLTKLAPDGGAIFEGNVGIGTTSPGAKLQIDAAASSKGLIVKANASSPDNLTEWQNSSGTVLANITGAGIFNIQPDGGTIQWQGGSTTAISGGSALTLSAVGGGRSIQFYTSSLSNERMRITSGGNIGIGNTAPGSKLSISGGLAVGTTSTSSTYLIKLAPDGGAIFEGNVGIGTTSPGAKLQVAGSSGEIARFSDESSGDIYMSLGRTALGQLAAKINYNVPARRLNFGNHTNSAALSIDTVNGNVGIGTTAPAQLFHVQRSDAGVVARFTDSDGSCDIDPITTSMSCSSDIRLKKDISTIPNALEKVEALRGVNYKWKTQADDTLRIGFVAQEVEPIVPELVGTDEYGMKSVRYTNFAPLLVNAIKELDEKKLNREEIGLFAEKTTPTPSPMTTPSATPTLSPTPTEDPSLFDTLLTRLKEAIFGTAAVFQKTVAFLGEVTFGNRVIFKDQDMGGFAVIKKGDDHVIVTFASPYQTKPIINITNEKHPVDAYLADTSTIGFTIKIEKTTEQDLAFNWSALAVHDPKTTESEHILSPIVETTPTPTQAPATNQPTVSGAKEFATPTPSVEPQKQEEASNSAKLQLTLTDSPKASTSTPTPLLSPSGSTASESATSR